MSTPAQQEVDLTKYQPPAWLLHETHNVEYRPEHPDSFIVRLLKKGLVAFDFKPLHNSNDVFGFGTTLTEAAEKAKLKQGN